MVTHSSPKPNKKQNKHKQSTQTNKKTKTNTNQPNKRGQDDQLLSSTERMVIALYHPWCCPQDWNGGQTEKDETDNDHKSRHSKLCEKGNQHNTERKPGLHPARSPEITQCSRTGNKCHRIGAIQSNAM